MNRFPLSETNVSVTIRARRPILFVLGVIWILIAVLCQLFRSRIPGDDLGVVAVLATGFAVVWWIWLQRAKLTVSGGYLEYRGGIFRSSKTALRNIGEIRNEYTALDPPILNRIPRVMVISKNGEVSMVIDPRPFTHQDLEYLMQILNRACEKKKEF
jgi:hypothetical protein